MQSVDHDFSALMDNVFGGHICVMTSGTAQMEKMSTIAMRVSSIILCASIHIIQPCRVLCRILLFGH